MSIDTRPKPSATALRSRLAQLAHAVSTPLVPTDFVDLIDPLRNTADLRGRIVGIEPETRDAATLVIRPGRRWRGHTPGQYVRIGVDVNGVRQWRAYSLTSAAGRADGCIAVTVKAIPDGLVSNHLVRSVRPGTVVQLDQAAGDFVLPVPAPAKALFITAGSGITPVMGMLRSGTVGSDVVLVHSAPQADDVVFGAQLRTLHRSGRITLIEQHTDIDGVLSVNDLARLVPDLAEREAWACGPVGLLDALEAHYAAAGLAERLHTERFRPTVLVTGDGGQLSFTGSATVAEADGATPLLDVAESAGVLMPSGCRMGVCFGCVLPLREGVVRDLRSGALTTAMPGDGVLIQTCISAAAGDCQLEH